MVKKFGYLIAAICMILLGFWLNHKYENFTTKKSSEQATVLLESIKKVTKLIAVEGYFSEIYDYKDYYGFDFSFLRKKALIRVKAKVSVGYNFEKVKMNVDISKKTITIENIGAPQILSIDTDLDYYDISQGTFNSFTNEDYNNLNKNAKDYIIQQVKKSDLMHKADEQKQGLLSSLKAMIESNGWQLIVLNNTLVK